jgi:regulator of ribonuclease activity A
MSGTSSMHQAFITCDLCDANENLIAEGTLRVLPPVFQHYGQRAAFSGQAVTVKCHEDNSLVKSILEGETGAGRVLVIDGGGSTRMALLGGNIAAAAAKNGWAGVVVFGAVRDAAELYGCAIGVRALALCPQRSVRRGQGVRDVTVSIAGVRVAPGDWVYADADGLILSDTALTAP